MKRMTPSGTSGGGEVCTRAFPLLESIVDVDDLVPDGVDRVHVMCIDDGGDVVLLGDLVDELVDHCRCLRVEPRVGFVAEEVLRVESYGTGDSGTLHHPTTYLGRVLLGSVGEAYTI